MSCVIYHISSPQKPYNLHGRFYSDPWWVALKPQLLNLFYYYRAVQCTEVRLASLLSGGLITVIVVNPPERKLAKRTSVQWIIVYLKYFQSYNEDMPHYFLTNICDSDHSVVRGKMALECF